MANTGYKAWANLEEYNTSTGNATGNTKPNVDTDPDYVAPIQDTTYCPLPDSTPPTFPTDLYITGTTTSSVSMAWQSADNVGVTKQTLWWREVGETWSTIALNASTTSYTKSNLSGDTTYEFYIKAEDAEGNVANSYNPIATTDTVGDTTPPNPFTVNSIGVTENSINVSWTDEGDNVGIDHWSVQYKERYGSWQPKDSYPTTIPPDTDYNITGLISNNSYEIRIIAEDISGNITTSNTIIVQTDSVEQWYILDGAKYHTTSGQDACNGSLSRTPVYINHTSFADATKAAANSDGTGSIASGWYSAQGIYRQSFGTGWTNTGNCF